MSVKNGDLLRLEELLDRVTEDKKRLSHRTFLPQCKYVEQSSKAYAIKTYIFILIIIYILTFDVKVIMVFLKTSCVIPELAHFMV
jgi:hypothetical protein